MPMSPRLLRPVSSGFNPRRLAGLSEWYDASVASSVTLANGFVSQWSDLSGNSSHLVQGVEANRPATSTLNGRNCLDFDGSNDYLENTRMTSRPGTWAIAFRPKTTAGGGVLYDGTGASTPRLYIHNNSTTLSAREGTSSFDISIAGVGQDETAVAVVTSTAGNATPTLRKSGTAASTASGGQITANAIGLLVGIRSVGGSLSQASSILLGEILIYNRVLSAAEITQVERYLARKWGVTLA